MIKKVWWEYKCENNHCWEYFRETNYQETKIDCKCNICGEEAVSLNKAEPSSDVVVTVLPTSRVYDSRSGRVGGCGNYHIWIQDISTDYECISANSFNKDTAIKYVSLFVGLNIERAKKIWNIKKLGNIGLPPRDK